MNVLILGSGGREHAFAWKISQSPLIGKLFVAPGNAGTAVWNADGLKASDFEAVATFCGSNKINLVLVGQEAYLVDGIADYLSEKQPTTFVVGPKKAGAMLEGSKQVAKDFMLSNSIPTARYFKTDKDNLADGIDFLRSLSPPFVLKADGLAAGKGVIIEPERGKAELTLVEMIEKQTFGPASERVVIEEFLKGIELSVFVLTNGRQYKILPTAKDYKRVGEGDTGPNTGGMGAISPVPFADEALMQKIEKQIIKPTIEGLNSQNIPYLGFLYIGLMIVEGQPYVIEYNCRMGDPETQAVLPRIESDLLELLWAAATSNLDSQVIEISEKSSCTVVLASKGYPGKVESGKQINGLDSVESLVFHAGTKSGNLTSGGRVIAITALSETLSLARGKALSDCSKIKFEGSFYRRDIGLDLLQLG